jgi:hypothetical protein
MIKCPSSVPSIKYAPKERVFIFLLAWYFLSSEIVVVTEMAVWYSLGLWWFITDRIDGHNLMFEVSG